MAYLDVAPLDARPALAPYRLPFAPRLLLSFVALLAIGVPATWLVSATTGSLGDSWLLYVVLGAAIAAFIFAAATVSTKPRLTFEDYFEDLSRPEPAFSLRVRTQSADEVELTKVGP